MKSDQLNKDEISAVVKETLIQIGIDVSDPEGIIAFQQDMSYVRTLRSNTEKVKTAGWISAFLMLLGVIYTALDFKSN